MKQIIVSNYHLYSKIMSYFIFKSNTWTASSCSEHWLDIFKIYLKDFFIYKRRERTDYLNSWKCPNYFIFTWKGFQLYFFPQRHPSHKGFPIDFKVGTTGVHISIEMNEKQIEIFCMSTANSKAASRNDHSLHSCYLTNWIFIVGKSIKMMHIYLLKIWKIPYRKIEESQVKNFNFFDSIKY